MSNNTLDGKCNNFKNKTKKEIKKTLFSDSIPKRNRCSKERKGKEKGPERKSASERRALGQMGFDDGVHHNRKNEDICCGNVKGVFNCVHCYSVFHNGVTYYNHLCDGKRSVGYLCEICEEILKTASEYAVHVRNHK
ncbi:hypothetical protein TNIN_195661 [Trichonephila inaurata madagascariensis]|uniref:C2H2-type domain-containing protein n=1 Tax=Trichonephila inaurata madagascariensis TaxID=2747483 RepID=A0A8X7C7A6_9ARAC|nr:hypothetical protein TNIN_195661 [Trichonephila inaurata madagascariensis]